MKKLLLSLALIGLVVFTGCKKEPLIPTPTPIVELLADEVTQALVDTLEVVFFNNPLISEVTQSTEGIIMDYPLFIDYDPFTLIVTRGNDGIDACVKGLEISKAEKELLITSFYSKLECQRLYKGNVHTHHRNFENWAKNEKQLLTDKYLASKDILTVTYNKAKDQIISDWHSGLLTLEQKQKYLQELETRYKKDLESLKNSYLSSLESINIKFKNKIKNHTDRNESCKKIKDCEKIYLDRVLHILGKHKYKQWIHCYKHHYKKK